MNALTALVNSITNSGSPLMNGRTKITTPDILGVSLTMRDFDFVEFKDEAGEDKTYPVIIFDELQDKFYCGGKQFSDICKGIDANGLKDMLKAEGLRVMLTMKRTKRGQSFVSVSVVE